MTMSDATLPPPRPSSPSSDIERREYASSGQEDFSMSSAMKDAGREHKSSSVSGDAASGDSERVEGKQRRKRTSPQDQAILEAEYKQNPKPNKAARAEIVKKVTLNEKEVQIWFQNRRQINRRKSRPLLPHEIAAFGLRGMNALSSDPVTGSTSSNDQEFEAAKAGSNGDVAGDPEVAECGQEAEILESTNTITEPIDIKKKNAAQEVLSSSRPGSATEAQSSATIYDEANSFADSVYKSFSSTPGYLANRWNNPNSSFSTPTTSQVATFSTPPIFSAGQPSSCPERISSQQDYTPTTRMRLSMSLDGKAELVESEPSPPRQLSPRPSSSGSFHPQKRMRTLERSQSAMPLGFVPRQAPSYFPFAPRMPSGRSRDTRTWEFCCDSDSRDELTTQAENESTGSALAAISLIRSTSGTALRANTNKRNAPTPSKHDPNKQGKKPKLGRAMSSLARLQNPINKSTKIVDVEKPGYEKDGLMRSPSGDSDKENWIPHENGANPRRRPLPSSRSDKQSGSRAVLGDNFNIPTHALNFGAPGKRRRKAKDVQPPAVFEDQENAGAGGEVEKFMRGEISPSKKGDLDCVQGLLSLSQGNWR